MGVSPRSAGPCEAIISEKYNIGSSDKKKITVDAGGRMFISAKEI